jgi:hypothetical protein
LGLLSLGQTGQNNWVIWGNFSIFRGSIKGLRLNSKLGVYPSGFYPLNIEMILLGSIEFIGLWHNWQNNLGQND